MQSVLFDTSESARQRDEGTARVAAAAGGWNERATRMMLEGLTRHFPDGALMETVRGWCLEHGLPEPHRPHAWGAVVLQLAKAGKIERTGRWSPSGAIKAHARMQPVWRATIYTETA